MLKLVILVVWLTSATENGFAQNCKVGQNRFAVASSRVSKAITTFCPFFTNLVPLTFRIRRVTYGCFNARNIVETQTQAIIYSISNTIYTCAIVSFPQCTGSCTQTQGEVNINCRNGANQQFRCKFSFTVPNCDRLWWSPWVATSTCADRVTSSLRTRTCLHCTGTVSSAYCPGGQSTSFLSTPCAHRISSQPTSYASTTSKSPLLKLPHSPETRMKGNTQKKETTNPDKNMFKPRNWSPITLRETVYSTAKQKVTSKQPNLASFLVALLLLLAFLTVICVFFCSESKSVICKK